MDIKDLLKRSESWFPEERCYPGAPKLVPLTASNVFEEWYLSLFRDLCPFWGDDLAIAKHLTMVFSVHVTYYANDGRLRLGKPTDHCTYWGFTAVLDTARDFTWYDVLQSVKGLNEEYRLEYATVRAPTFTINSIPKMLHLLGGVLPHLRHLECQLNHEKSCIQALWADAFQLFPKLTTLIIHNAGSYVLHNVHRQCRELKSLVLKKFAISFHMARYLDFPLLELLIMDEMDYCGLPAGSYPKGRHSSTLPHLTHLTVQISSKAHLADCIGQEDRFTLDLNVPKLESLIISDVAADFLYLREIKQMSTMTINMESCEQLGTRRIDCFGKIKLRSVHEITFQADDCNLNLVRVLGFLLDMCTGFRQVIIEMRTTRECITQVRLPDNSDPDGPLVQVMIRNKKRLQRSWSLRPTTAMETAKTAVS